MEGFTVALQHMLAGACLPAFLCAVAEITEQYAEDKER